MKNKPHLKIWMTLQMTALQNQTLMDKVTPYLWTYLKCKYKKKFLSYLNRKSSLTNLQQEIHQGTENRSPDLKIILTRTTQHFNTTNARNTTITKVKRNF